MKTKLAALFFGVLSACMFTGCTTQLLWTDSRYHPMADPKVQLYVMEGQNDVLVTYQEQCGKTKRVVTRAYWALDNSQKIAANVPPKFADRMHINSLALLALPVSTNTTDTDAAFCGYYGGEPALLHLWHNGEEIGGFKLPDYKAAPPATWWRVGLTPVTVATDAFIISAYCYGYGAH